MKQITLLEGIGIAVLSVLVSLSALFMFQAVFGWSRAAIFAIGLTAILYLAYLCRKSRLRAGKVTITISCLIILSAAMLIFKTLSGLLLFAVGIIWIVRSLLFYSGILPAGADSLLCIMSLALADRAVSAGGGIVTGVWVFFLMQSLWVLIPEYFNQQRPKQRNVRNQSRFNRAYETAEEVIRKLGKGPV